MSSVQEAEPGVGIEGREGEGALEDRTQRQGERPGGEAAGGDGWPQGQAGPRVMLGSKPQRCGGSCTPLSPHRLWAKVEEAFC